MQTDLPVKATYTLFRNGNYCYSLNKVQFTKSYKNLIKTSLTNASSNHKHHVYINTFVISFLY